MPLPSCTPNVNDTTKPNDASYQYCLAAEIRAIKTALATLTNSTYQLIAADAVSASSGWSNTTLASGGWKDIKLLLSLALSIDNTLLLRLNNKSGANDYLTQSAKVQAGVAGPLSTTGTSILLSANNNIDSTARIDGFVEINNIDAVVQHGVNGQVTYKNDSLQGVLHTFGAVTQFSAAEALTRIDLIPGGVSTMTGSIILLGRK